MMAKFEDENMELEFLISQYLDGQLQGRQKAQFERRLKEDASLAEQLRQYSAVQAELDGLALPALEAVDFDAQRASIMSRLERTALLEHHPSRPIIFRPAFYGSVAAAASVVLAVVLGLQYFTHTTDAVAVMDMVVPPGPTGLAVMEINCSKTDGAEAPAEPGPLDDLPSGTVMISINSPQTNVDENPTERSEIPFMQF